MPRLLPRLLLITAALLLLAACSPGGSGGPSDDPYADLDVAPPSTIEDPTITTSGTIAPSERGAGLYDINVAGFAMPEALSTAGLSPASIADLPPSAFTVVEDNVVKGITVERIGGEVRAAADVVFVFDTTISMGAALSSVQNSIVAFADHLDDGGLDVRLGAVTFGDAYDTQSASGERGTSIRGAAPASFDLAERPTFPLSDDYDAFRAFIEGDSPRGGGDWPENGLGALDFAYEHLEWRTGAQRLMIFVTDICQHTPETFEDAFGTRSGYEQWMPPAKADLLATLRGNATVHVIAPSSESMESVMCPEGVAYAEALTGAAGTGGEFVDWTGRPEFDLTELPIAAAARGGYVITYRGTEGGEPKEVRVVIDDGGNVRGEFTLTGDY